MLRRTERMLRGNNPWLQKISGTPREELCGNFPKTLLLFTIGYSDHVECMLDLLTDETKSRVGAVALYTVLWTVVVKYRKWPFSALHRTKTP
jgi:hypothetical protein